MKSCRAAAAISLAFAAFALMPDAKAQDPSWPGRPVTIVVPFTQGTGGDTVARTIAPRLSERWKQPVIVDNRAGASGTIGSEVVARSAPNGYTLLLTVNTFTMVPSLIRKLPFDPVNDFAAVGMLVLTSYAFTVNPAALPARDFDEFVAAVRKQPGKFNYASPGNGTPHHLAIEMIKMRLGLNIVHVPYKGSSGAIVDLLSGQVQAMIMPIPTAMPHVQAGKIKLLAVTGANRWSIAPDVPTFRERGMEYMDSVDAWYAIIAPARTPRPVIAKLNQDLKAVMEMQEVRNSLMKQSMTPAVSTPEEFDRVLRNDIAHWARVVAEAKIEPD